MDSLVCVLYETRFHLLVIHRQLCFPFLALESYIIYMYIYRVSIVV